MKRQNEKNTVIVSPYVSSTIIEKLFKIPEGIVLLTLSGHLEFFPDLNFCTYSTKVT